MSIKFSGTRAIRRGAVMAVVGIAALVMGASTAGATGQTGHGNGTGSSDESPVISSNTLLAPVLDLVPVLGPILEGILGDGTTPLCGRVGAAGSTLTLNDSGTYTTGLAGATTYTGATTATIHLNGPYSISPVGTFSDTNCTVPGPVPATVSISGSSGSSSVSCSSGAAGSFVRANTSAAAAFTGASCTVNSVTDSSVVLSFAGNMLPCGLPPIDPCGLGQPQYTGVYAEN